MKTLLLSLLAAGTVLASALSASAAAPASRPVAMQVTTQLPASANIIRDADIAETFGYLIAVKLREQGFRGRIGYYDYRDELTPGVPHLALQLHEWRVDPSGNVDCTFTANLTTDRGSKSLGQFMGSAVLAWPFGSWSAREAAFERAATDTVNDLLKKIRASNLLPEGA